MKAERPKLLSDFDGTAVKNFPWYSWRAATKFGLPMIPGYTQFLDGVLSAEVDVAGVASRRAQRWRGMATSRSIASLGLTPYFPNAGSVTLAGSEVAKAQTVVNASRESVAGMLEDRPHLLGAALLKILKGKPLDNAHTIVMGVVSHPRSSEYIDRLATYANQAIPNSTLNDARELGAGNGFSVVAGNTQLQVLPLVPYTKEAGAAFGEYLWESQSGMP